MNNISPSLCRLSLRQKLLAPRWCVYQNSAARPLAGMVGFGGDPPHKTPGLGLLTLSGSTPHSFTRQSPLIDWTVPPIRAAVELGALHEFLSLMPVWERSKKNTVRTFRLTHVSESVLLPTNPLPYAFDSLFSSLCGRDCVTGRSNFSL